MTIKSFGGFRDKRDVERLADDRAARRMVERSTPSRHRPASMSWLPTIAIATDATEFDSLGNIDGTIYRRHSGAAAEREQPVDAIQPAGDVSADPRRRRWWRRDPVTERTLDGGDDARRGLGITKLRGKSRSLDPRGSAFCAFSHAARFSIFTSMRGMVEIPLKPHL
jgi:hypothetical protein